MGGLAIFQPSNASSASTPIVTIEMGQAFENSAGVPYTVTLSAISAHPITVTVRTNDGSATTNIDFDRIASQELVIPANELSVSDLVTIINDTEIENDETLSVSIVDAQVSSGSVTIGSPGTSTGTILDDDPSAVLGYGIVGGLGLESAGTLPFTVTISSAVSYPVTFEVKSENGSATTADSDYQSFAGREVVIAAGQTSATSQVVINNNTKVEADETFSIEVESIQADGESVSNLPLPTEITIENDDQANLTLTAPEPVMEGDSGQTPAVFQVELDNAVEGGFQIQYESNSGTASVSDDFEDNDDSLTFSGTAGETKQITVNVIGDTDAEGPENFSVILNNLNGTDFGSDIAFTSTAISAIIVDDDSASLFIADAQLNESAAGGQTLSFDVTLTTGTSGFTINYATADGTATAGEDYTAKSGTLTFSGNAQETQTVDITIGADDIVEGDETLTVKLSNISDNSIELMDDEATGTILNDDQATLTLSQAVNVDEQNAGTMMVPVNVVLSNPVQGGFDVVWELVEDTASEVDDDFSMGTNRISFLGSSNETKPLPIVVVGDSKVELDESFSVSLGSVSGLVNIDPADIGLSSEARSITILNDDAATVSLSGESRFEGTGTSETSFIVSAVLSADVDVPVTLNYETVDGTAVAGDDFVGVQESAVISGSASIAQTFVISVTADSEIEPDEMFSVVALSLEAAGRDVTLGSGNDTAIMMILDDDENPSSSTPTATTPPPATETSTPTIEPTPEPTAETTATSTPAVTVTPSPQPPTQIQAKIYLPITNFLAERVSGPDLVVSDIEIGRTDIIVTIKNIGDEPVTRPFWVDSYINPTQAPTRVNQPFDSLTNDGFVWGIELTGNDEGAILPLDPGEEVVLTVGGQYYREDVSKFPTGVIQSGVTVYVQVDSFGTSPVYGQIEENHEMSGGGYNNISSAVAP
ncbi:MAG: Calx-beta domain-containing protein [Chloroflexota bacterium]